MDNEYSQRVKKLCISALEYGEEGRRLFLDKECGADQVLRRELESLLSNLSQADAFLEHPPAELVAGIFSDHSDPGVAVGDVVSHYRILEKLGQGGMGVVFKAKDTILGRFVALKFLPHAGISDSAQTTDEEKSSDRRDNLQRLEREARAASALDHPAICTVYEVGQHQDVPFIAMQYLSGHTIKEEIGDGPVDISQLLNLAIQIGDGLETAHRAGIIHCDIKAANVFLTTRGKAKILDFGLAKLIPVDGALLEAGHSFRADEILRRRLEPGIIGIGHGTPAYMSPEQVRGEKLDARTDLYSFGVVLYELATGKLPFQADAPHEMRDRILYEATTPPSTWNPNLPREIQDLILKALEKDREARYQTVTEMLKDLRSVRARLSRARNKPSSPYIRPRWVVLTLLVLSPLVYLVARSYGPCRPLALTDHDE